MGTQEWREGELVDADWEDGDLFEHVLDSRRWALGSWVKLPINNYTINDFPIYNYSIE